MAIVSTETWPHNFLEKAEGCGKEERNGDPAKTGGNGKWRAWGKD